MSKKSELQILLDLMCDCQQKTADVVQTICRRLEVLVSRVDSHQNWLVSLTKTDEEIKADVAKHKGKYFNDSVKNADYMDDLVDRIQTLEDDLVRAGAVEERIRKLEEKLSEDGTR